MNFMRRVKFKTATGWFYNFYNEEDQKKCTLLIHFLIRSPFGRPSMREKRNRDPLSPSPKGTSWQRGTVVMGFLSAKDEEKKSKEALQHELYYVKKIDLKKTYIEARDWWTNWAKRWCLISFWVWMLILPWWNRPRFRNGYFELFRFMLFAFFTSPSFTCRWYFSTLSPAWVHQFLGLLNAMNQIQLM